MMKKVYMLVLLLILAFAFPIAFAEENETIESEQSVCETNDDCESGEICTEGKCIETEIEDETNEQVQEREKYMKSNLGAKMRVLQLEKSIRRNILHGEAVIEIIKENHADYNLSTLNELLDQLNLLVIELEDFDGYNKDKVNHIYWVTVSEINNEFFTLERSRDAVNWTEIAIMQGAGNSNTPILYEYDDESYDNGTNYYRLKQTDFNGVDETFETISIITPFINFQDYIIINLIGQEVKKDYTGIRIIIFEDGKRILIPSGFRNPMITR